MVFALLCMVRERNEVGCGIGFRLVLGISKIVLFGVRLRFELGLVFGFYIGILLIRN